MGITYGSHNLVKRIINWHNVEKVIYDGNQIWPSTVPPTPTDSRLCFTANTSWSQISLQKMGNPSVIYLQTSRDWITRNSYNIGDVLTLANAWDKLYRRSYDSFDRDFSSSQFHHYYFVMSGSISASWDINYLKNRNSTNNLSDCCYYSLFKDCTALTTPPQLPATTMQHSSYHSMFSGCTSLTEAPQLPATTLGARCYESMFSGCTSLTEAPQLPAWQGQRWKDYCYFWMFSGCTSLTTIPSLPATTLWTYCYAWMFNGCTKIKISETQGGEYQIPYRVPASWDGRAYEWALEDMFANTWWTFTGTPNINQTYYIR